MGEFDSTPMAVNEQELCDGGYFPVRRESCFALGCDLGQAIDPTALAIVERIVEAKVPLEVGTDLRQRPGPPRFELRYLERLPLQTPYPAVIAHVAAAREAAAVGHLRGGDRYDRSRARRVASRWSGSRFR